MTSVHVNPDSTTTVVGTVLAKDDSCTSPGGSTECLLKTQVGKDVVYVVYNYNGMKICVNETAAGVGGTKLVNDRIQVYGAYQQSENRNMINTCPFKDYYIK